MSLNIWKTARKHAKKQRINDDDILQVATFPHWIEPLDEENPQRDLRFGSGGVVCVGSVLGWFFAFK